MFVGSGFQLMSQTIDPIILRLAYYRQMEEDEEDEELYERWAEDDARAARHAEMLEREPRMEIPEAVSSLFTSSILLYESQAHHLVVVNVVYTA